MPRAIRLRIVPGVYPLSLRRPRQLSLVLLSLLVGAATHILWDSFTHGGYWPARHFPWFWETLPNPVIGDLHYYKILQYLSTGIGLLVVLFWILHWMRTAPVQEHPAGSSVPEGHARLARILIPAVALLGGIIRGCFCSGLPDHAARARILHRKLCCCFDLPWMAGTDDLGLYYAASPRR